MIHQWSWLGLVLLAVQLMLVQSGWREYRRFAPERMEAEHPENEVS